MRHVIPLESRTFTNSQRYTFQLGKLAGYPGAVGALILRIIYTATTTTGSATVKQLLQWIQGLMLSGLPHKVTGLNALQMFYLNSLLLSIQRTPSAIGTNETAVDHEFDVVIPFILPRLLQPEDTAVPCRLFENAALNVSTGAALSGVTLVSCEARLAAMVLDKSQTTIGPMIEYGMVSGSLGAKLPGGFYAAMALTNAAQAAFAAAANVSSIHLSGVKGITHESPSPDELVEGYLWDVSAGIGVDPTTLDGDSLSSLNWTDDYASYDFLPIIWQAGDRQKLGRLVHAPAALVADLRGTLTTAEYHYCRLVPGISDALVTAGVSPADVDLVPEGADGERRLHVVHPLTPVRVVAGRGAAAKLLPSARITVKK